MNISTSNFHSSEGSFTPIDEHRLIFTPNNPIYKTLMDRVSGSLKIGNASGVTNAEELKNILMYKGLIAGIEFHNLDVRLK